MRFKGNYMKQARIPFSHKSVVNIYIVYELNTISSTRNTDFPAQNCLFGAVKITKDTNTSHNQYFGYRICFDEGSNFSFGNIVNSKYIIIFGADMSFSSHATNKANNIYVLGKDFIQGINGTTIYAEKIYKHNFTEPNKKFVLSLYYNGYNSYLFVNGGEELQFKAKINGSNTTPPCFGNLSSDWSTTEATNTGLNGNVYEFAVKTIYDIHRYLMKLYEMFNLKKVVILVLMSVSSVLAAKHSVVLKDQECVV